MQQAVSRADEILAEASLVTLPEVYARLKAVLEDPDYCMADIVEVVSNDPGITARLLRVANSGYFGLATQIDSVARAVSLLGAQEVHDLVLATSVLQSFEGMHNDVMDMHTFWRKSVVCAIAAKELAVSCNVLDSDRLFVAGLLRDIGHLFLYQKAPRLSLQAQQLHLQRGIPLHQAERSLIGIDFAHVGAEAMRIWGLPEAIWGPTAQHVEPSRAGDGEYVASLVHIAAVVADSFDAESPGEESLRRVSEFALRTTGLLEENLLSLPERVEEELDKVMGLLRTAA